MSGGVFISYRREDARGVAGRIYDRLSDGLGSENVFFDVDNIAPGLDFVEVLSERVGACDALVAIIGKGWLASADTDGGRRLDREDDFVHIEIEAALRRSVPVIPVLVEDATMPRSVDLPESLRKLARRQGVTIDHARFNSDVERLIRVLSAIEEDAQRPNSKSEAEAAPPRDAPPAKLANASRGGARRLVATLALTAAVILALGAFLVLRSRAPEPAQASADLARPSASASLHASLAQTDPPADAAPPLVADPSALLGLSGKLLKTPNAALDAPVSAETLARELAEQKDLQDQTQQKLDELSRAANAAVRHIRTDQDPTAAALISNESIALSENKQSEHAVDSVAGGKKYAPTQDANPLASNCYQRSNDNRLEVLRGQGIYSPLPQLVIAACREALDTDPANPRIQYELASTLALEGSFPEAVPLLRQAANAGFAQAQAKLGALYQGGLGVEEDHAQAMAWYTKAADQGDKGAKAALERLRAK